MPLLGRALAGLRELVARLPYPPADTIRAATSRPTEIATLAQLVVTRAINQLGYGEAGGNNHGPDLEVYGVGHGEAWCAAFADWCCRGGWADRVALLGRAGDPPPWARSLSARGLVRNVARAGQAVRLQDLRPGDLICWPRGKEGWQGHVGLVEVVRDGLVHTIEGNVGRFPAKVRRLTHDVTRETIVGCARLPEP